VAERIVVMCDQGQGASKTASEERRICKRWDTLFGGDDRGESGGDATVVVALVGDEHTGLP